MSEAFNPRQIRDGEEDLHFSEIWFQLWKAEAGAELKNLKFGCSIEINNESTIRILKEAYKRCQFTDGVRAIDPAAGADQEQALLALSGSVSGSTFYRMLRDHPIEFNGTKVLRVHACSIAREEPALFWEFGRSITVHVAQWAKGKRARIGSRTAAAFAFVVAQGSRINFFPLLKALLKNDPISQ